MGHQLILEVPKEVYEALTDSARRIGVTPESLAVEWLLAASHHAARDPVESFIGAFRSSVPDWADRHDQYLGQALRDQCRGEDGAGE
jgi:hypothetical protein